MPRTTHANAGAVFFLAGVALFGGSFALDVTGLWGVGVGLMVFGIVLWWSGNRREIEGDGREGPPA
jgi:hypothetical protein